MTKRLLSGAAAFPGCQIVVLMVTVLIFAGMPVVSAWTAIAADLDGVSMPPVISVAGHTLRLNGMGLRTYSIFHVHIYVAGLYLERPTSDAEAILQSDQMKLMMIRFVHDVSADQSRQAWSDALAENCVAPCHLSSADEALFLSLVPPFHRGDESVMLFDDHSAQISVNGRHIGTVTDPAFARTLLANFIGRYPPTEAVRRGLLGIAN
jgi:hypothetical protein